MTVIFGADVSGWQAGNPNWGNLDFAYIKASEGTAGDNPHHWAQMQSALAKGLIVGHYHYPAWGDPVAEATWFLSRTGWVSGQFLVLDIESSSATPWPADPVGWCVAFEREVYRRTGVWCLDYIGPNVRALWNWAPLAACGGGLISPEYNPVGPSSPDPWTFVAMWQNADTNITGGDSDEFFGDRETLIKYGTPSGAPAPVVVPTAPAPTPIPAPAPSASTFTAAVESGDTFTSIAAQFGVTLGALESVNPGINYNLIHVGQIINVPGTAPVGHPAPTPAPAAPSAPSGTFTAAVQAGDTFSGIAAQFGVSLAALEAVNPGINYDRIFPGQIINVPGHVTAPAPAPARPAAPVWSGNQCTVEAGDTFSSIAAQFGCSLGQLEALNPGVNYNLIYPGQVLNRP